MAKESNLTEQLAMQLDNINVSFDPAAFDNQANQKGSELEHWANLPCPNANFDTGDVRSSHTGECCENGRIYFLKGIINGIFTQVNKSSNFYAGGTIDHSMVYLIIPRFYSNTQTQIIAAAYDKLIPKCSDATPLFVTYWEQQAISPAGIDYLSYPAEQVEYLVDASGQQYFQDVDFTLVKGAIVWKGQRRPTTSLYQQAGACYSVRYFIKPVWLVQSVMHDIRTIKTADPVSGEMLNVRYPQYLVMQKQINFMSNKNRQPGNLSDHFAAEQY